MGCNTKSMTNNHLTDYIRSKGRDIPTTPAPKATYPREIHGRVYQTEAEYREALHDFLNGM